MKKLLKTLLFIPVIALSACGENLGKEADAQAAQQYQAQMAAVEEAKNVTFSMTMSGTGGPQKIATSGTYKMKQAENGDVYYYLNAKSQVSYKIEIYRVKNEKYEEVTYVKVAQAGQSYTLAYGKKDNALYEEQIEDYLMTAELATGVFYAAFASPDAALDYLDGDENNTTVTYYSNGEKNLSIKAVLKDGQPENEDDEEYSVSGQLVATYNDYRFASASVSSTSNLGNKSSAKLSASYGKVSISLPSGWENLLNKAAK